MSEGFMVTEVKVPATGNAAEDAVILEWHSSVGDRVEAGAVLVSLETAKAVIEVDCPVAGTLLAVKGSEGDEVREHQVIAVVGDSDEPLPVRDESSQRDIIRETGTEAEDGGSRSKDQEDQASPRRPSRPRVSPRARKLAAERDADLSGIGGSGPSGRVVAADVPEAVGIRGNGVAADRDVAAPLEARAPRVVPVRGARRVTAERMQESAQAAAQVTITRYAPAEALTSYVRRFREIPDRLASHRIGINELLLFAVARTVGRHPSANAWFSGDTMSQFDAVHLGFAVDTEEALLVPVIRNADLLGLSALAGQTRSMIQRARDGELSSAEMDGGTFTVSNMGGLGVHWFTPILNPPQVCILGVGAIQRGRELGSQLPLSLTFDHRALDGAEAARLLAEIAEAVEHIDTLAAF